MKKHHCLSTIKLNLKLKGIIFLSLVMYVSLHSYLFLCYFFKYSKCDFLKMTLLLGHS